MQIESTPNYSCDNIFHKILTKELSCDKVYEDDYVLAFKDISPLAEKHILVIPKFGCTSYDDFLTYADQKQIISFFSAIKDIIKLLNLEKQGYRIISNAGQIGMQTVQHFHCHIISDSKELGDMINVSAHN